MSDATRALIFGPTLPPGGVWGQLTTRITGIEVTVNEQTQRVALNALALREIGFGKPGVELAWHSEGAPWAAHVLDPAEAAALLATPAMRDLPQRQALRGQQRKVTTGRAIGWSILALFVLFPLLLVGVFFWQADRIAAWITEQIPIEQERQLGEASFASMKPSLKLIEQGAAYEAVNTLGKRLTAGSKYQYQFHVVEDDTLNAFAMPGGIVVVHTGLIKATQRPEELAGVLAHEVQHVEQRHSLEGMVKNLGLQVVWAMATGDLGGTLASQAALQLTSLKFSRDAETEADTKGLDTLVAKGIDPSGMPDFFKTMGAKAGDAPAAFISTHPLSKDREAALQRQVQALPNRSFTRLDLGPWPP